MPKLVNVSIPRKKEAGQALIAAVAALGIVLMGFAGLGIDMGYMRYQKRLEQTAADAAAIAGADDVSNGFSTAAQNAAAANGFAATATAACPFVPPQAPADAVGTVVITVNNPPCPPDPHDLDNDPTGAPNYVEVYVSEVQPVFFMRVLGVKPQTVTARAVATKLGGGTGSGCLYALGGSTSVAEGLTSNGNGTVNGTECGIVDNGNLDATGGTLNINAGTFGLGCPPGACGGTAAVACSNQADCPVYGEPPAADPVLASHPSLAPPCAPCTGGGPLVSNGTTQTFNPGTYTSIFLQGPGTDTFNAGTYIIDGTGGFSCSATMPPAIFGTGVTFYFTNGATFNCMAANNIQLSAPTSSGQYPGILFYQDTGDASPSMSPGGFYGGVLYFPNSAVTFSGTVTAAIVVADEVVVNGTLNLQGNAGLPTGATPITNSVLVE